MYTKAERSIRWLNKRKILVTPDITQSYTLYFFYVNTTLIFNVIIQCYGAGETPDLHMLARCLLRLLTSRGSRPHTSSTCPTFLSINYFRIFPFSSCLRRRYCLANHCLLYRSQELVSQFTGFDMNNIHVKTLIRLAHMTILCERYYLEYDRFVEPKRSSILEQKILTKNYRYGSPVEDRDDMFICTRTTWNRYLQIWDRSATSFKIFILVVYVRIWN